MEQNSGWDSQPEQNQRQQHQSQQQQLQSQSQWMAVQYPAAAMVMEHQMMQPQHFVAPPPPLQHYMPYYHHHQYHAQQGSSGENKTVWIDSSIKVVRNKQTGLSEGYGFVEFFSHATAETVLQNYIGILMPNTEQPFRLNWATFSTGDKHSENGFVRFGDDTERSQAMTEMNGVYCSSRPMRIGAATPRKSSGSLQQYSSQGCYASNGASTQSDGDSSNTTIFVGGLDPNVTEEDLRQPFSQYGEIVSVKIPVRKGCGFIQFANRNNAEEALQKLNGAVIGKQTLRLSWGRNPANKQFRADYGSQWGGAYYGGQVSDGYGYALQPHHDPGMYAAAYGAYPIYGSHQQQVS
ncbi:hypothetical protein CRYUN_Cryun27aG0086700 [Craigia yunnanensis]